MVPSGSETLRRKEWQVGQMLLCGEVGGATMEAGFGHCYRRGSREMGRRCGIIVNWPLNPTVDVEQSGQDTVEHPSSQLHQRQQGKEDCLSSPARVQPLQHGVDYFPGGK